MSIYKKASIIFLALLMFFVQIPTFADEKAEVVKSYYLLKYEYAGFLEPLQKVGVKESQLIQFFRDVEKLINDYDDVSKETIEKHLKNALFTAGTYSQNIDVAMAVLSCYGDEFDEYSATGKIPENLQGVYNAVIDSILRKDLPDKLPLIESYEQKLKFLQDNSSKYTDDAVSRFRRELGEVLSVLMNINAKQEEIDLVNEDLNNKFEAFKECLKPSDDNENNNSSGGKPSQGSSSSSGMGNNNQNPPITVLPEDDSKKSENMQENEKVSEFYDVSADFWGYDAINYLSKNGVLNGFDDGSFKPDSPVTREQFAKMIVCALELEETGEEYSYTDASAGAWYVPYINTAASYDIMHGIGDSRFGIGSLLKRQDMAVVAYRLYEKAYIQAREAKDIENLPFKDVNEISNYALENVTKAYMLGLINGMSEEILAPQSTVTRAQAAQVIYNSVIK